jgi:hypothetical protein
MIGRAAKQAARSFLGVNVWRRKQLLRRGEFITFLRRNYYSNGMTRRKLDDGQGSCSGIVTPRPAPERAEAAAEMFVAFKPHAVFCFSPRVA